MVGEGGVSFSSTRISGSKYIACLHQQRRRMDLKIIPTIDPTRSDLPTVSSSYASGNPLLLLQRHLGTEQHQCTAHTEIRHATTGSLPYLVPTSSCPGPTRSARQQFQRSEKETGRAAPAPAPAPAPAAPIISTNPNQRRNRASRCRLAVWRSGGQTVWRLGDFWATWF